MPASTYLIAHPDPERAAIVYRSLELAARLARVLGGEVAPMVDVPPEPVAVALRRAA